MRAARGLFGAAAVLYAGVWAWSFGRLPDRVPTHFGTGGVDSWSSRGSALTTTAVLGLAVTVAFAVLVRAVAHSRSGLVNVPNAGFWRQPEHVGTLRRLASEDLWLLGAWTLLLLSVAQALVVRAAGMATPSVGPWAAVAVVAYVGGVVARVAWMYAQRYAVHPA